MTLIQKQQRFMRLLAALLTYATAQPGVELTGGELWRSPEELGDFRLEPKEFN